MKESEVFHRKRARFNVLLWIAIVISVALMIGFIVTLFMLGFSKLSVTLLTALCGGFFGGTLLFGVLGLLFFRCGDKIAVRELDALEREDDEHSFYVGEGTLATLQDDALQIHGGTQKRAINVPYFDVKFYSVCSRKAPRERGAWSVLIEIPAKYVNHREERGMKPVLIQADGKERLYARIHELGLELKGEDPKQEQTSEEKFTRMRKFVQPDKNRRIRAGVLMGMGVVLIVGGILSILLLSERFSNARTIGSIATVIGIYALIRGVFAFKNARAEFSVYREGVYFWNEGKETLFLKWEEMETVEKYVRDDGRVLRIHCPYGNYDFPLFEGCYEYIAENFSEMVLSKNA